MANSNQSIYQDDKCVFFLSTLQPHYNTVSKIKHEFGYNTDWGLAPTALYLSMYNSLT